MLKFENTQVVGWDHAIRGMRNPMESWDNSDSGFLENLDGEEEIIFDIDNFLVGLKDYELMSRLRDAGTDHRKFMRMIGVYVDITGPLYWWKEFDTYKVGTVANSCSTMHKIAAKEFTMEDFSTDKLVTDGKEILSYIIQALNDAREVYLDFDKYYSNDELIGEIKNKKDVWWQMIQLLPSSYNQKRTVLMNYEVLANIYKSRKNHKLDEWSVYFMDWIKTLPYSELITGDDN